MVSVSSSSCPLSMWRDRLRNRVITSRRTSGSPPVRRSFLTPRSTKGIHKAVQLLKAEKVRLGRKVMCSAMQYDTAEIAAVGHRNAQIGDGAAERIHQRSGLSRRRHAWPVDQIPRHITHGPLPHPPCAASPAGLCRSRRPACRPIGFPGCGSARTSAHVLYIVCKQPMDRVRASTHCGVAPPERANGE